MTKRIEPGTTYVYVSTSRYPVYHFPSFSAGLIFAITLSRRYPTILFTLKNVHWQARVGKGGILSFRLSQPDYDQSSSMRNERPTSGAVTDGGLSSISDFGNGSDGKTPRKELESQQDYDPVAQWDSILNDDSSGDGVSSAYPHDPLLPDYKFGDIMPNDGDDSGVSEDLGLPQFTGNDNSGEWVDQDIPKSNPGSDGYSELSMGMPGYGDYANEVEEGTVLQPSNTQNPYDSAVWYDNEGEPYFYDQASGTFSDLNGVSYTPVVTDGITYIGTDNSGTGGDPADILRPDWNDPGDDDSWVENYDDLPTDEDGEVDFSGTFGLDDGE